jgi:3-mercaptopyruvate sulfurtransferase SseA
VQLGYTYIMIFQGGMPEWTAKGLPVATGRGPGTFPGSR